MKMRTTLTAARARASRPLAQQALDQVPDGHPGRDGVRIDDEVGSDALRSERHVFLAIRDPNSTLLTMTRSKFITDLRNTGRPYTNLHELLPISVRGQEDLVNNAVFCAL